jgi:hydroxysqualene dehydroxylase
MQKTVHIVGAGISGLSAAVRLANAGWLVRLHEATQTAGGRCRSYFDAATNLTIDNGNHLLLSGNHHALAYARSIGTQAGLVGPKVAQFPFVDVASGQRWLLDLGNSRLPLWVLDESRRVPDTGVLDYLKLAPLVWASTSRKVGDAIPCNGTLYQRLVQPLLLAALNVDPPEGSAGLAGAVVRETLLAGGQACRPLIARDGLSSVLIEPAVKLLQDRGAEVRFSHELRQFVSSGERVTGLKFGGDGDIAIGADDAVVMAVPPRGVRPAAGREDADQVPRHRERAFPLRSAGERAGDPRRGRRPRGMAVRVPEPPFDHHQQRRPPGRHAARGACECDLGRCLQGIGRQWRVAALADRPRTPCHV